MPRFHDTIAALATPVGTAAIAVVRVSGVDAARLVEEVFREAPPPRVARHGDYVERGGALVDDVLYTLFRGPHSYTGEDSLEISCHGNPFIAQKILGDLFARGCRPAEPGEFTQRAFLNGQMDLSQAEAVMDMIHARSDRALAAANQQLRGALGRRIGHLVDGLLGVLAQIEAYIDFPEEDLPPENREAVARELQRIATEAEQLLATSRYGELLRDGIKTVIVGAPNVGKSSLLNRLVGRDRALVSPEPGTTRDFIEECIAVGPHWLRVIDTAGLNPSPAPLEKLGMDKTLECIDEADLLLIVMDASAPVWPAVIEQIYRDSREHDIILVMNKKDLINGAGRSFAAAPKGMRVIETSALAGEGIDELIHEIVQLADRLQCSASDDGIAINARHAHALHIAKSCLMDALQKIPNECSIDLLASDIRGAMSAFADITGVIDNERMLDKLFASFCIGK